MDRREESKWRRREDGNLNSGNSIRGRTKWTDLGYILEAYTSQELMTD